MPDDWGGNMRGCGLLVVNPPFGFEEIARSILDWLWPVLSRERDGGHTVEVAGRGMKGKDEG